MPRAPAVPQANRDGDTPLSRCLASATAATAEADGAIFKLLVDKGAGVEVGGLGERGRGAESQGAA